MSVDSTEELQRQIQDAQTSEFDEWLKGFEENAEEDETGEESPTSQESSHGNPSEESLFDINEAIKGYNRSSLWENVDINEPWKYIPSAEVEVRSRMLANLDRQLEFQVRRRKDAHEKFQKKWDKTFKKQDILVHALAKFSVLFDDCKDKRKISRDIYNVTSDEIQYFTNLISRQTAHSRHLSLLLKSLEKRKKNYQPIRDFLKEVKEVSEGKFADVTQVINRAAILENIRLRLIVTEWESERERGEVIFERFGLDYKALKSMLGLSNEQSQLHIKRIVLENEVKAMEDKLHLLKTQLRDKDVLVSQLKLCVNNLYSQLCRRLGIPPAIADSKPMQQLENINSLINELRFLRDSIYESATAASDVVDIEVDTRATEKLKLKLKLGFK